MCLLCQSIAFKESSCVSKRNKTDWERIVPTLVLRADRRKHVAQLSSLCGVHPNVIPHSKTTHSSWYSEMRLSSPTFVSLHWRHLPNEELPYPIQINAFNANKVASEPPTNHPGSHFPHQLASAAALSHVESSFFCFKCHTECAKTFAISKIWAKPIMWYKAAVDDGNAEWRRTIHWLVPTRNVILPGEVIRKGGRKCIVRIYMQSVATARDAFYCVDFVRLTRH